MHRQRQRAQTLRVRRQSERGNHAPSLARRSGRRPRRGIARHPYGGQTPATVIPATRTLVGNTLGRAIADAGYRGHNAPPDYKFKIFTAGQKRRVTPQIKRESRRRAAIEPVIGQLKEPSTAWFVAHSPTRVRADPSVQSRLKSEFFTVDELA